MKKILFLAIFAINQVNAQQRMSGINIEIGGTGLIYNIGYERFIKRNHSINIGASFIRIHEKQTEKSINFLTFPISSSHLLNIYDDKHFAEAGIGVMNLVTSGDLIEYKGQTNYFLNPFIKLGYRYMPKSSKWQYKLTFTPFYGSKSMLNPTDKGFTISGNTYQLWGGISLGYRL